MDTTGQPMSDEKRPTAGRRPICTGGVLLTGLIILLILRKKKKILITVPACGVTLRAFLM